MLKFTLRFGQLVCLASLLALTACHSNGQSEKEREEQRKNGEADFEDEEHEKYDGPMERGMLEFEKTKDPALGTVPVERLWNAVAYTENLKNAIANRITTGSYSSNIIWTERGPIYDSLGPSNGNGRAGVNYTSGRTAALLVDASDATGNTVYCGGIAGGLWKCTNLLDTIPNWQHINDQFDNLAISSICQDPTNPDVIYFATGEATSNADAVYGRGVWKTTNHGITWTNLTSTLAFNRNFKILCDSRGYVYLATRGFGLRRSTNGGSTWTDITPNDLTATYLGVTSSPICTDIEISSTDKLHASFGYNSSGTTGIVNYRYTTTPASVSNTTWLSGTGIRTNSTVAANRLELATLADTLYAVTTNTSNNVDSCYKSIDGGANWSLQNTVAYATGVTNTQGWYDLTLTINPDSSSQILVAGLDAYLSRNSGNTVTRKTFWVSTAPYVHADHHYMQWWKVGGENRILMGTDGGVFLSRDLGTTFKDKNRNLAIKQFYAVAMHPTDPNYLIAGAQDNGTHQIKYAGLSPSIEVTGGDGCFVYINQLNPLIQFGSYVYNSYRRSVNGGSTWSSITFGSSTGLFVNPFDYDDTKNLMYASNGANAIRRWPNANTASVSNVLTIAQFVRGTTNGNTTAFKVSPFTANRVFIGGSQGKLIRLDNADTVTTTSSATVTDLTATSFPNGYINCVNTGTTDDNLVAVFTNYGVENVWVSGNGGTSWTSIDGDLPDMPVRWAAFFPGDNSKMVLATEAGIYITDRINGAYTEWLPSLGFPTVRTDMIKIRTSDNRIAAATHGRGLWTGIFSTALPLSNIVLQGAMLANGNAQLTWKALGATANTQYQLQYSTDGRTFTDVAKLGATVHDYKHTSGSSPVAYYRILATDPNSRAVYSNTVLLHSSSKGSLLTIYPNPVGNSANLAFSSPLSGNYTWQIIDMQGRAVQTGNGTVTAGGSSNQTINTAGLPSGTYRIRLVQGAKAVVTSFVKQ